MKKDGKKKGFDRWRRVEFLAAIALLITVGGILLITGTNLAERVLQPGNAITGFVSTDIFTQDVSLEISSSQRYDFLPRDTIELSSLRISGEVIGSGLAQVFLEVDGQRFLVYNNIVKREQGNLITGLASGNSAKSVDNFRLVPGQAVATPVSDTDVRYYSGEFYQQCVESCFMSLYLEPGDIASLVFYVDEGTALRVTQITYTS